MTWTRQQLQQLDRENLLYVRERLSEAVDTFSYPRHSNNDFVRAACEFQLADEIAVERGIVRQHNT